jgi:hypothetical protein
MTRAGYAKTRTLRLTVRKLNLTQLAPGDLLYSLPTICDVIPGVREGSTKVGKRVLELHEDDWRQIELVAAAHRRELQICLQGIERIYETERTPGGAFKSLHVRKEIPDPLSGVALTMEALMGAVPRARKLEGLAYQQGLGLIEGGFAVEGDGLTLFGIERNNGVEVCCFRFETSENLQSHSRSLARLTDGLDVVLVDWCRARAVDASEAALGTYLSSLS